MLHKRTSGTYNTMVTASGAGCDMGPWMGERVLEARSVGTAEVRIDTCAGRARGAADALAITDLRVEIREYCLLLYACTPMERDIP